MKIPLAQKNADLIVMAPMQIKPRLSMGNIYDLTIIDFYAKAKRLSGDTTVIPLLWNINGKPLLDQMVKARQPITEENTKSYIEACLKNLRKELEGYYLNYDFEIRDDQVSDNLKKLAEHAYASTFTIGETNINECTGCGAIFGSDPSIQSCKHCGAATQIITRQTAYKAINKKDLQEKIAAIEFTPPAAKAKLENFIDQLPDSYDLILEKNRANTLTYASYKLDPRFIAILLPAVINSAGYKRRIWIHGDVVKKLDYYGLCYLNVEDCPTEILMHGIIQNTAGKKMRWQDSEHELALLESIDKKVVRALFLTSNILRDRTLNAEKIKEDATTLTRLYVKMSRLIEERNLEPAEHTVRTALSPYIQNFHDAINTFNYRDAFKAMTAYIDAAWKIVKNEKLSAPEHALTQAFRTLYFGK